MAISELKQAQNYLKRDFESIREDLITLLKVHYPESFQDFNSPGIGMALVELQAYVADLLSYHTDKKFNEQFLDGINDLNSAFRLAKTFGFNPPGYRTSISIVDLTIEVPVTANGPDPDYLPIFRAGLQLKGASKIFETIFDCNYSSDFSDEGTPNRIIEPILNANQDIIRYKITKREKIKGGITKIFKKEISAEEAATPFLEINLPDSNVLEVLNVIVKPSLNIIEQPTYQEFNDFDLRFFEVESLAENKTFLQDDTIATVNGVKTGRYETINQRFVKEFMSDGNCRLTFGGGTTNFDAYDYYLSQLTIGEEDLVSIRDIFDNSALGTRLPANSTLYVKYRVGGGTNSNVGSRVLSQVANISSVFTGTDQQKIQSVVSSVQGTNILPAIGGMDLPTVDEIKHNIGKNYAAQKRCVTLDDYISRAYQIPGKFGAPFRIHGKVDQNKVILYILSKDAEGKLASTSTSTMKNNLIEYLTAYRMINDFIQINDGKIINLSIEVDLFIDKNYNSNEVKINAIQVIKNFFNINNHQMGEHIYNSQLVELLREVAGVINVVDVRYFNIDGGSYSPTIISQAIGNRERYINNGTYKTQIQLINNAIYGTPMSMFEIRSEETDLSIRVI
jgi:hypothetical protein